MTWSSVDRDSVDTAGIEAGMVGRGSKQPLHNASETRTLVDYMERDGSDAAAGTERTAMHKVQASSSMHAASIIASEVLGTGVMGLPKAMAQLGWVVGISTGVSAGVMALCAGLLLEKVRNEFYPSAASYADVALEVGGPRWRKFTGR